jgi:hypothetical protein
LLFRLAPHRRSSRIPLALYVHPVDERDAEAAEHFGTLIRRQSLQ